MSTADHSPVHGDTTAATTGTDPGTAPSDSPSNTAPSVGTSSSSSSSSTHSETPAESTSADQYPHHVIFVVHGMGRQLEEFGNYERNVSYLVENTKAVLQSQFHELKTDVHIIPIEWHAKLHSMVDERMALASLRTVPKVRLVMNDYFADILYYFNNHYGTEIIRMIVEELNEAYETFLAKHPDFNGKISVYALSLGGVAMFDILTCLDDDDEDTEQTETKGTETKDQDQESSQSGAQDGQEPNKKRSRIRKQDQPKFRAVVPKLKFRPDYLFTVGSPVGAVMVMRNLDWETFHPPDDIIHHNIFHPFDPLGYRIEPLIDPVFAGIPAVTVTSYSNSQLFPSISLPSLPSLLPMGTISSFWENRVPNLPRPSIPTFATLTSMTQSLGAGRWLSGSTTGGNELEEEGNGVAPNATKQSGSEEDQQNSNATDETTIEDEINGEHNKEHAPSTRHMENGRDAMIVDGDASVTEYMVAATAATYLDQGEGSGSSSRPADSEMCNDTTTGSHTQVTSSRRPSLGPRTISSRVETGEDDQTQYQQTLSEVTEDGSSTLQMEYYLGMERGPTAEERARGLGAKSDVVQESMVRSLPSDSSCLSRGAKSPKDGDNPVQNESVPKRADETVTEGESQKKQEGVRATSESLPSPTEDPAAPTSETTQKARNHSGSSRVVHVEGRPTKVPYRVDHVLQESTVDQYTNEYLLGMRSHFRYWGNRDVAYHILRTMLQPTSEEEDVLDLKLTMPTPVTTSKGAKEAAESKAKATARSRNATSGVVDQETKKQNRMSFTFSFFGGQSDSTGQATSEEDLVREQQQRRHQEEVDEDFAMMDEEGELFGYRYSDLDMNHSANASSLSKASSATLFQNSPFATGAYASDLNSNSSNADHGHRSTKRRISLQSAKSSGKTVTAATSLLAFEEGVVLVPDLARPAKLHHRSSRVEEKQ